MGAPRCTLDLLCIRLDNNLVDMHIYAQISRTHSWSELCNKWAGDMGVWRTRRVKQSIEALSDRNTMGADSSGGQLTVRLLLIPQCSTFIHDRKGNERVVIGCAQHTGDPSKQNLLSQTPACVVDLLVENQYSVCLCVLFVWCGVL